MRKGEIWQVRIPFAPGHAQTGERPAVILTEDVIIPALPTIFIVPCTSSLGTLACLALCSFNLTDRMG